MAAWLGSVAQHISTYLRQPSRSFRAVTTHTWQLTVHLWRFGASLARQGRLDALLQCGSMAVWQHGAACAGRTLAAPKHYIMPVQGKVGELGLTWLALCVRMCNVGYM